MSSNYLHAFDLKPTAHSHLMLKKQASVTQLSRGAYLDSSDVIDSCVKRRFIVSIRQVHISPWNIQHVHVESKIL